MPFNSMYSSTVITDFIMSARHYRNINFAFFLCCTICVFLFLLCFKFKHVNNYKLEKVVIFSRHNLRTPLSKNLKQITPYSWPVWKEKPGILTHRGFILEGYMGAFFVEWFHSHGLLPDGCPDEKLFFVYAHSMQRTMESANAFVRSAFPNCNITIHKTEDKHDPFSSFIHNNSETFRKMAINEIKTQLNVLHLKSSYEKMDSMLEYQASDLCKLEKKCDLVNDKNMLNISVGKKPMIRGPLKLCNEAVDAFLMEYYNGFSLDNVAWGKLTNITEWQSILGIRLGYHNVIFNSTIIARDIARPLIMYMKELFTETSPRVSLLMGHDSNINVILNAMGFKYYTLNNSLVSIPIGGKIVFQKWYDIQKKERLLKINYIYQSSEQVRDMVVLNDSNPPQFVNLELKSCLTNENGYCSWDDFINFLNDLYI